MSDSPELENLFEGAAEMALRACENEDKDGANRQFQLAIGAFKQLLLFYDMADEEDGVTIGDRMMVHLNLGQCIA